MSDIVLLSDIQPSRAWPFVHADWELLQRDQAVAVLPAQRAFIEGVTTTGVKR